MQARSLHRHFRVYFLGSDDVLTADELPLPCLWIDPPASFSQEQEKVSTLPMHQVQHLLGSEVQHLVFDARKRFDPNAFAQAADLVIGGGTLVLILPNILNHIKKSPYMQRLFSIIPKYSPSPRPNHSVSHHFQLTSEQEAAFEAIVRTALGHRRRPLVITAERGRGKSTILGYAAAQLLRQNTISILVTAPHPRAITMLFRHAALALAMPVTEKPLIHLDAASLRFIPPDELLRTLPPAQLLLVDEAAGIPTPQLEQLLQRYSRIVFSTTRHGYEGSGQGFVLRFFPLLDQLTPQWRHLQLHEPVRWAKNDPLEAWLRRALLLDAQPPILEQETSAPITALEVRRLEPMKLIENEARLSDLFGLLRHAHYRTTPRDLMQFLDDPNVQIWALESHGQLLGCALTIIEPPVPARLQAEIMAGKRRLPGHFLNQALATQCNREQALSLSGMRISRIAIHPQCQGQGLGSHLLSQIEQYARRQQLAWLGASFGATLPLVRFWQRNQFFAIRLGFRQERRSGQRSILMLKALSAQGEAVLQPAQRHFQQQFPLQLNAIFNDLDPHLAMQIMKDNPCHPTLEAWERLALERFAQAHLQYLDCLLPLYKLTWLAASRLSPYAPLALMKVLQGHSWQFVAQKQGLAGKKQVLRALRRAVETWLRERPSTQI